MTDTPEELNREIIRREVGLREAQAHPAGLMRHMQGKGRRDTVAFRFNMSKSVDWDWQQPDVIGDPWSWQRDVVDWIHDEKSCLILKARQLGATWLGCGLAVWTALYQPGSLSLLYRTKEEDAYELTQRSKVLFDSLPSYLHNSAEIITPSRGHEPKKALEFKFPDGSISSLLAQSSSDTSGHGREVAFALLDEYGLIDNGVAIMTAVNSAVGNVGTLLAISTANGVSNEQTGGGSYFHWCYWHGDEIGLKNMFLPYWFHPERGPDWKKTAEYLRLPPHKRAEQYPQTPTEAFTFSNAVYFDAESMLWYGEGKVRKPKKRADFVLRNVGKARLVEKENGWISVYREPQEDHQYAIGADTATGRGLDFSSAYVVDLSNMEFVAEFHGKLDADLYAEQLHYLGKYYNTALIAVEDAGGFGSPVIIALRDGREGRPAYSRLYRHRQFARLDQLEHKTIGFPMNKSTRPAVLEHFEETVRERSLPWLTEGLIGEMQTFIRFNPNKPEAGGTWPRAQEGCNDDRVMAAAITLEMFRQRGEHPRKPKRKTKPYKPAYAWDRR